jgi:hypothetical protein
MLSNVLFYSEQVALALMAQMAEYRVKKQNVVENEPPKRQDENTENM